jgi:hypothetical protein
LNTRFDFGGVMRPFPSREDVAIELILRECGMKHEFPRVRLEATETETDGEGRIVNVNRTACPRCGTVKVMRWRAPDPAAARRAVAAMGTFERPDPADVPGLAQRAATITDEQYADFAAECGYPGGIPDDFAPDRRATAAPERLELVLRIRAGQFALTDRYGSLGDILPVPGAADSTDLVDAVQGAALFWPPVHDGELALAVLISPAAPAPDRSYASITEVSCRFQTGYVELREIGGRVLDLPPLPAGHGDYRLRFHAGEDSCLLQIWPQPAGKPRMGV